MGLCFPAFSQDCMLSKSLSLLPKAFQVSSAQTPFPLLLSFYCPPPRPLPTTTTVSTWWHVRKSLFQCYPAAFKHVAWLSDYSINYPNSKGVNPPQRSEMKIRNWLPRRQSLPGWSSYAIHWCDLEKAISGRLNFEKDAPFSGAWAGFQAFLPNPTPLISQPPCALQKG